MNGQIIFASLRSRPVRTLVSVLAVALEVVLIVMIVGLTTGFVVDTSKRVEGVGADILVRPPGASVFLALSSGSLSQKLEPVIARIDGVKAIAPVLVDLNTQEGIEMVQGIDPVSFDQVSGGFTFLQGRMFSAPDDIIVDDVFARANGKKVGDRVHLLNHDFVVSGIVEHGKGARVYLSLPALQNLMGVQNRISFFYVDLNTPSEMKVVQDRIVATLGEGYTAVNAREYASLMTAENIPGLNLMLSIMVFISVCVGVMVIFLSMYTTITERTREIGILRSLGGSKSFIVILTMQESIVISVLGILVGLVGAQLIRSALIQVFPTIPVVITTSWRAYAALFAILSGVIGAFYPSLKAAAKDPIEALAYE